MQIWRSEHDFYFHFLCLILNSSQWKKCIIILSKAKVESFFLNKFTPICGFLLTKHEILKTWRLLPWLFHDTTLTLTLASLLSFPAWPYVICFSPFLNMSVRRASYWLIDCLTSLPADELLGCLSAFKRFLGWLSDVCLSNTNSPFYLLFYNLSASQPSWPLIWLPLCGSVSLFLSLSLIFFLEGEVWGDDDSASSSNNYVFGR